MMAKGEEKIGEEGCLIYFLVLCFVFHGEKVKWK